jgi:enamine deaminase RidA (YjgF/YER057c/UK114 family)
MQTLQPSGWPRPRGFTHGVVADSPGRWIILAGQTGADEKGEYDPGMGPQTAVALRRVATLLRDAGAGPEHIVRLTWYLTSRNEYVAAAAEFAAAWRESLGRNFPPSTLLYVSGLVDTRAKVEIEVTAFVPAADPA